MAPQCSNCETTVNETAAQCPACGAQFTEDTSTSSTIPASWLGVGTGVIVVALLLAFGFISPVVSVGVGAGLALIVWIVAAFVT